MVVSVLITRFELTVATGGSEPLLGRAVALAPPDSRDAGLGEVSATAEARGVRRGMRIGEAIGRCPELVLVPPDPVGAGIEWERVLSAIEGIGAAVASPGPGRALFEADGLLRLHGGIRGLLSATSGAVGRPVRLGVAAGQFAASVASTAARPRRPVVVDGGEDGARRFLAPRSVRLLDRDRRTSSLPTELERLGLHRLGDLASMSADAIADRFGRSGMVARELALGRDSRLLPRTVPLALAESLELPESAAGSQLVHALDLLAGRLLARPELDGLTLRSVEVSARLDSGGTWRRRICFREALGDCRRMMLALTTVFDGLPSPAAELRLAATSFGPPVADRQGLFAEPTEVRIERLRQAILQSREAAGPESALRAVAVEPGSRLPERRMALVPFEA